MTGKDITGKNMADLLSMRFWRGVAVKYLPESIKGPLRYKLHGGTAVNSQLFDLSFTEHGGEMVTVIKQHGQEETISFRVHNGYQPLIEYSILSNKDCAEEMFAFIELAKSKHCLFDAGANFGLFSLVFCGLNKENKTIAFDPSPEMVPILNKHITMSGLEGRMQVEPYAVGNKEGSLSFSVEKSGFVQVIPSVLSTGSMIIPVTTIDIQCQKLGIYPDILKIDVEGCELETLQGAEKLLRTHKPAILVEVHLNYLETLNIKPKLITDFLKDLNYEFYACTGEPMSAKAIYDSIKPVIRFVAK